MRHGAGVGGGVPVHYASWVVQLVRPSILLVGGQPDRDTEVVTERLADRTGFFTGAEAGHLRSVHGVPVLVHDDFGVLGIVHAALAVPDPERLVGLEGVVSAVLVDLDLLLLGVDRRKCRAEPERR